MLCVLGVWWSGGDVSGFCVMQIFESGLENSMVWKTCWAPGLGKGKNPIDGCKAAEFGSRRTASFLGDFAAGDPAQWGHVSGDLSGFIVMWN
jgi:hypothetical protein